MKAVRYILMGLMLFMFNTYCQVSAHAANSPKAKQSTAQQVSKKPTLKKTVNSTTSAKPSLKKTATKKAISKNANGKVAKKSPPQKAIDHSEILKSPKYAALVIDQKSNNILYQENATKKRHPASLVKVAVLYEVFDALERGTITLDQKIPVSANAASKIPLKLGLKAGSKISVRDAMMGCIVHSANDAAAALAEFLGGTEEKFAEIMTRRARSLGMMNTQYRNASGLHHPEQYTNAVDMSKLAVAIQKDFPQHYHLFNKKEFQFCGKTVKGHNRLMNKHPHATGLKTGFTAASGFNIIVTTKHPESELLAVVFGGPSYSVRDAHAMHLLDNGHKEVLKKKSDIKTESKITMANTNLTKTSSPFSVVQ
jgi:D-alanyl-D-alanine carboxypeptidase